MSAKFEIFLGADHQYYFRLKASNRKKRALSVYENSNQPPLSRQEFIRRLIFHAGLVFLLISGSLSVRQQKAKGPHPA